MSLHPKITDTDQALVLQPLVGHPDLGRKRLRQPPVALAADGRQNRLAFAHAERKEIPHLRAYQAPLLPVATTLSLSYATSPILLQGTFTP